MRLQNFVDTLNERTAPITPEQIRALELWINRFYNRINIDVSLSTRHFIERLNDPRNATPLTVQEIGNLFAKVYNKYNRQLRQQPEYVQAVLRDLSTHINLPFVLEWDRRANEMKLFGKTILRKPDFHTSNPVFAVESAKDDVAFHQAAMKAYRAISQRLYDAQDIYDIVYRMTHFTYEDNQGPFYIVDPKLPEMQGQDFLLIFGKQRYKKMTGTMGKLNAPYMGTSNTMIIEALPTGKVEEITDVVGTMEFLHLFTHEYTHYLDSIRWSPTMHFSTVSNSPDDDVHRRELTAHFNSSEEYNAYFHQIASSLLAFIDEVRENPADAAGLANMFHIFPSFKETAAFYLNNNSHHVEGFLAFMQTPTRYRALKRLYKLWELAWQEINSAKAGGHAA